MTSIDEALSKKLDRVKKAVEQFPTAATALNDATDQLGKSIGQLDVILKRFSLGIPTWVSFDSSADNSFPHYYSRELGYAKVGGKWGIAVRSVTSEDPSGENEEVEQWLFNDAPRLFRVRSVEVIPELLEELLKRATEMSKEIAEKAEEVDAFAEGIISVIDLRSKPIPAEGLGAYLLRHTESIAPLGSSLAGAAKAKVRR